MWATIIAAAVRAVAAFVLGKIFSRIAVRKAVEEKMLDASAQAPQTESDLEKRLDDSSF